MHHPGHRMIVIQVVCTPSGFILHPSGQSHTTRVHRQVGFLQLTGVVLESPRIFMDQGCWEAVMASPIRRLEYMHCKALCLVALYFVSQFWIED